MHDNWVEPLSGGVTIAEIDSQPGQTEPYVSVVIAAFNMGVFVAQAVKSILDQAGIDYQIEILMVDDGSTDNTQQQLAQFASDDRVQRIHQSNQRQTRAKNSGIQASPYPLTYWPAWRLFLLMPRKIVS